MTNTPKPMEGTWTLTAPDGRTWRGDTPLHALAAESSERVPPEVALERILKAAAETPLPPWEDRVNELLDKLLVAARRDGILRQTKLEPEARCELLDYLDSLIEPAEPEAQAGPVAPEITDEWIERIAKRNDFNFYGKWMLYQGDRNALVRTVRACIAYAVTHTTFAQISDQLVEAIAKEWDGCKAPMFDFVGNSTGTIDIGATIRASWALRNTPPTPPHPED